MTRSKAGSVPRPTPPRALKQYTLPVLAPTHRCRALASSAVKRTRRPSAARATRPSASRRSSSGGCGGCGGRRGGGERGAPPFEADTAEAIQVKKPTTERCTERGNCVIEDAQMPRVPWRGALSSQAGRHFQNPKSRLRGDFQSVESNAACSRALKRSYHVALSCCRQFMARARHWVIKHDDLTCQ
jgi:hypothetical protein